MQKTYSIFLLLVCQIIVVFNQQQCTMSLQDRLDCGFDGITQQQCEDKQCCWKPVNEQIYKRFLNRQEESNDNYPWCFFQSNFCNNFNFEGTNPGFQGWFEGLYKNYMENINIGNKGGVVASPDTNTPGGSYFYHWMRDAALTMRTFMEINDFKLDSIQSNMDSYVSWVFGVQNVSDPHGQSVLSEPKFFLPNGEVYTGPWCRPQTDGPGLRAGTLIKYSQALIQGGLKDKVTQQLWTSNGSGIIQKDLDWVASNWQQNGCDLWEEIQSTDFFWNRMAFHQSMVWGSEFAQTMGDTTRAQKYQNVANSIKPTLLNHWNGSFVYESSNRQKDSSVVHAFVSLNEGVFDITGKEVAGTIQTLNKLFCSEYLINQQDDSNGIPGILYGRYQGDNYAGGNPWQLLTAALAQAFYQGAQQMIQKNDEVLLAEEVEHWRGILKLSANPTAKEFATAAKSAGDSVMQRLYTHVKNDNYNISEQIDRNTGLQISAKQLTWSFANILRTLHLYTNNSQLNEL